VRGFCHGVTTKSNPHSTLSLDKGEAKTHIRASVHASSSVLTAKVKSIGYGNPNRAKKG